MGLPCDVATETPILSVRYAVAIMEHGLVQRTSKLACVFWLGGSPCAGKTSIATTLAQRYHWHAYHFDRHEADHIARSDPERHPALHAFLAMSMDDRWVRRPPAAMARNVIRSWSERFGLVLEDLLALAPECPIIAEGPGLFPDCVAPLLGSPRQAVWLVPTAEFCAAMRRRRGSRMPEQTSDPARAWQNLIDRDMLLARYVRRRARALGLTVVVIDGSRSVDEVADLISDHAAPWSASYGA